jgi:DHA2 family multidrug resistance protein-like MFS transporter
VAFATAALAILLGTLAVVHSVRTPDPFIDPRLFRDRIFSGAVLVSLLTGYALATAIIGGAVWVDRVRYAGSDEQRVALGTLALAMAAGALGSGIVLRSLRVVPLGLLGLAVAATGTIVLGTADPASPLERLLVGLAVFGVGFGMTVTPRSTAAVEALGRRAFGIASAGVTVARTVGMAIGLGVLTGFGTQRIEALSVVLTDQAARDAVLPPELRGRILEDPVVVDVLERWAAGEAASVLAALFLVAGVVLGVAVLPTLLMDDRPGRRKGESIQPDGAQEEVDGGAAALAR